MDAATERKLRDMLDRDEIHQVLMRYGRGIDRNDRDMVRSCYWDDALDDHGEFVGDVEGFIDYAFLTGGYFVNHHHGMLNHSCEVVGDDAHAETYYQFVGIAPVAPHLMAIGRYVDHFQRRGAQWRIFRRVCVIEGKFELGEAAVRSQQTWYYGTETQTIARDPSDFSYRRPVQARTPVPQPL